MQKELFDSKFCLLSKYENMNFEIKVFYKLKIELTLNFKIVTTPFDTLFEIPESRQCGRKHYLHNLS